MMKTTFRGNLVASTRSNAIVQRIIFFIIAILLFFAGITMIVNFREYSILIGWDVFKSIMVGYIISVIVIFFCFAYCARLIISVLSYCEVYEECVVGVTNSFKEPVQKFEISYNDIKNVTESGKVINIYTSYATHTVFAMKNRAKVIEEIRARIENISN